MARLLHTLSLPEHIWLDFFRQFFSQDVLYVDEYGNTLVNEFRYDEEVPPEQRAFNIMLDYDDMNAAPDALPMLVLEDNGESAAHMVTDNRTGWSTIPTPQKERTDLVRGSYTIHCLSRTRGSSRLLASIVVNAITTFYDILTTRALHRIDPWSIGKTVSVSQAEDVVVDTPINVSFTYEQQWITKHLGNTSLKTFNLVINNPVVISTIATTMRVLDTSLVTTLMTSMSVTDQKITSFVSTLLDARDQISENVFIHTNMNVAMYSTRTDFIRTTMRVV